VTLTVDGVIEQLGDLRLAGFYTQELLYADGRRVGFEAIGLHGDQVHMRMVVAAAFEFDEREKFSAACNLLTVRLAVFEDWTESNNLAT
jgi:hypothetical protein